MNRIKIILTVLIPTVVLTAAVLVLHARESLKSETKRVSRQLEENVRLFNDNLTENSNLFTRQVEMFASMLNKQTKCDIKLLFQQSMEEHPYLQAMLIAYDPAFLKEVQAGKYPDFQMSNYFKDVSPKEVPDNFAFVCYHNAFGNIAFNSEQDHHYDTQDWYLIPRCLKQGQWTNPFAARKTGTPVCAYGLPFYHGTRFAGVVACMVPIKALTGMNKAEVKLSSYLNGAHYIILGNNGRILYHSEHKTEWGQYTLYSIADKQGMKNAYSYIDQFLDEDHGVLCLTEKQFRIDSIPHEDRGNLWFCYQKTKNSGNWTLLAVAKENDMMASHQRELMNSGVLIFCTALLIGAAIATLLIRANEPLFALTQVAEQITEGNLDAKVQDCFIHQSNSLGTFAGLFNKMVGSMRTRLDQAVVESAVQARMEQEADIAQELQESFLPANEFLYNPRLHYAINAKLIHSTEIGGDFYDSWALNDHQVAFMVADVAGRGIAAAMSMVAARTMFRQVAEKYATPGETLSHVNSQLILESRHGIFISVFLAYYDTETGLLHYSNAGHSSPIILRPGEQPVELGYAKDIILGVTGEADYSTDTLPINPGDMLLLYTNGILNLTSEDDIPFDKKAFFELLAAQDGNVTNQIIPNVTRTIEDLQGDRAISDDIALLLFKRTPVLPQETGPEWGSDDVIISDYGNGDFIIDSVQQQMEKRGWSDRDLFAVNMAMIEGVNNAIEHGNSLDNTKKVYLRCRVSDNRVFISIRDEGPGFREDTIPDPRLRRRLACPTGRGILLIRSFMSHVTYNEIGNEIRMEKYRSERI